jgi:hypothetical protein
MSLENRSIPDWARQERGDDLAWIEQNREVFWAVASLSFDDVGRGAIVVDTTLQPIPGQGHPLAYFSQKQIEAQRDEDTKRMVAEYDPATELVLVLLKPNERSSTYRVCVIPPELQAIVPGLLASSQADELDPEPAEEPTLRVPDIETLMEWEAEGWCEAACPHGCRVEPDGHCPHGHPSWLLKLGLI